MTKKYDRMPQGAQKRTTGVVVFAVLKEDRPWGFVEPAGSDGSKENNIFYGSKSIVGDVVPQRGDEVEFLIDRKQFRAAIKSRSVSGLLRPRWLTTIA